MCIRDSTTSVCNKPTRSTQPCIPLGSLNRVPALIGWVKGGNVTSVGWQVTLCDAIWDVSSRSGAVLVAQTAIRFLTYISLCHYRYQGHQVISNSFGDGTGTILMDDLGCTGSENTLADCYHRGWADHNCDHDEDVAVECTVPTTTTAGKKPVYTEHGL